MIKLIGATAALAFATSVAYAECSSQHMAKAKTDPTTTASVATEQPKTSAPAMSEPTDQPVIQTEE